MLLPSAREMAAEADSSSLRAPMTRLGHTEGGKLVVGVEGGQAVGSSGEVCGGRGEECWSVLEAGGGSWQSRPPHFTTCRIICF